LAIKHSLNLNCAYQYRNIRLSPYRSGVDAHFDDKPPGAKGQCEIQPSQNQFTGNTGAVAMATAWIGLPG